jgi:hypothetical protein
MMPHGPGAITFSTGALVALAFLAGGCRGQRVESPGTHVSNGDILSGRLDPQVPREAFTFEGVESSLLDFTLQSDELNRGAPHPVLTAPDGQEVDLHGHRMTPEGAATTRYEGIILRRTGTYRLTVESTDTSKDSWYLYRSALRFPSIVDERAKLTAGATHPISFTAPYGATVSVRVRPANSPLQPDVRGVIDPLGGRALDPGSTPGGVLPPQMAPTTDGGVVLVFVAPRAGRYTVLASAKPGHEGEARIDVDVTPPQFDRAVWHPGADPTAALGPPGVAPSIGTPMMQRCAHRTVTPPPAPPSTAGGWSEPAPIVMPASAAPVARR